MAFDYPVGFGGPKGKHDFLRKVGSFIFVYKLAAINCFVKSNRLRPFHLVILFQAHGPWSQFCYTYVLYTLILYTYCDDILMTGDFNIHLNKSSVPLSKVSLALTGFHLQTW